MPLVSSLYDPPKFQGTVNKHVSILTVTCLSVVTEIRAFDKNNFIITSDGVSLYDQ
jgi:general stress protein CsbA